MEQKFPQVKEDVDVVKWAKKNALAETSGSEAGQKPSAQVCFTVTRSTLKCKFKSSRSSLFIEYSQFYLC